MTELALTEERRDALQEIANLAMGQAARRLAVLLDAFIELSVPRVRVVAASQAADVLREMTGINEPIMAVRQGFRSDIKGEAIVLCRSSGVEQLCALVNDPYPGSAYESTSQQELVFDIANVLTGACVSCIFDQLGRAPVFSAPGLLGTAMQIDDVFQPSTIGWATTLLVEVNFALEDQSFRTHLVMLLADDSIRRIADALDALLSSL